jgi:CTP:molybdopterin cytidylyltransferase MocA
MIGAVVLAAGRSQRMGQPKLILPWGDTTIIGRVVSVLATAQIDEIVVVTGGRRLPWKKFCGIRLPGQCSIRIMPMVK